MMPSAMFRRFFRKNDLLSAGEVARRVHSLWLTKALRSDHEYPRIPVRAVSAGGFAPMMATPEGPRMAREWWDTALSAVDAPGTDDDELGEE